MRHFAIIILMFLFTSCKDNTADTIHIETNIDTTKVTVDKTTKLIKDTNHYDGKIVHFNSNYKFENFKTGVYTDKLADPKVIDKELSTNTSFIKYITDACKGKGVNFSGHYTIVQSSCGAMCEGLYIVDRLSGKVFSHLKPNNGGRWGYLYKKDSKMLIANSNALDDSLKHYSDIFDAPEIYVWTDKSLRQLQ